MAETSKERWSIRSFPDYSDLNLAFWQKRFLLQRLLEASACHPLLVMGIERSRFNCMQTTNVTRTFKKSRWVPSSLRTARYNESVPAFWQMLKEFFIGLGISLQLKYTPHMFSRLWPLVQDRHWGCPAHNQEAIVIKVFTKPTWLVQLMSTIMPNILPKRITTPNILDWGRREGTYEMNTEDRSPTVVWNTEDRSPTVASNPAVVTEDRSPAVVWTIWNRSTLWRVRRASELERIRSEPIGKIEAAKEC